MVIRPRPSSASCLYFGHVVHRRLRPVMHRFRYQVCGLLIDLDELTDLKSPPRVVLGQPVECVRLLRARPRTSGRIAPPGLDRTAPLAERNRCIGRARPTPLFSRLFGYVFNPLTVWFCHRRSGDVAAVVLEVRNMAGESYSYLLSTDAGLDEGCLSASFDKQFYVSGFVGMDARYECCASIRAITFRFRFASSSTRRRRSVPSGMGRRVPLTDASLLYNLVRFPLMTFKIGVDLLAGAATPRQRSPGSPEGRGLPSRADVRRRGPP